MTQLIATDEWFNFNANPPRKQTESSSIDETLNLLDEMYSQNRLNYDEYSQLYDAIGSISFSDEECYMITSGTPCKGNTDKQCTHCGAYNIGEFYDNQCHRTTPSYCPNCGAKVKNA